MPRPVVFRFLRVASCLAVIAAGLSGAEPAGSSWDRVPLYVHFGKRDGDLTPAQLDFLAANAPIVALEKSHGASVHGSTEAGIAADRKSTRLNSSHVSESRMPSSA